ncbi:PD-(D/E)XK nuclease family protein [Ancylomarina sp. 16SWW S1-10-2]|uniref:PD-(D/E)XK nuclease family protein n=1 Tax=Ancylomarina sp. 16SWW S1-10-2 TaxID=2499681 RepID=UPI0012AD58C0|nr:PD-(D/E)XK nuclease family protein [Ancylomarina sp. 16SWW S1-10-2]MRT92583.1 hypothetical protein [Ancylomarina sp. 16SWW S1-10-2]
MLGNNELALSKAFAYILGTERKALNEFLKFLNINIRDTEENYKETSIEIEYSREEGRTDIEIQLNNEYHIIIEAKVKKNRVLQQRTQYLNCFDNSVNQKVLCFITQERDSNKQVAENIEIINTSWLNVIELYDKKEFTENELIVEFLRFVSKNYKMNELKEILIQDLSDTVELDRYKTHNIYRRDPTFGTPLYFAPYFTRDANQPEGEGIAYLSKILGVLTLIPNQIENFELDLRRFKNDDNIVKSWINGVKLKSETIDNPLTYYFLDDPVQLKELLIKEAGNHKGVGKNWIAKKIPKNRCVSFQEFVTRMNK